MEKPVLVKREIMERLLRDKSVYVYLDPRRPGVVVPASATAQACVVFEIGLNMAIPIPDLQIDNTGFRGTLSFVRDTFFCDVPWDAVFLIRAPGGESVAWDESRPKDLTHPDIVASALDCPIIRMKLQPPRQNRGQVGMAQVRAAKKRRRP